MKGDTKSPHDTARKSFDYFGELAGAARNNAPDTGLIEVDEVMPQGAASHRWRRVFKALFVSLCVWFAWQYADMARYSFRSASAPLEMGDVTTLAPEFIEHNTYVCVEGISEHRGMTQKLSRGLGLAAQSFWYFRLLGSRGVFVEVQPDAERYATTQRMRVCGRAVDPTRSKSFAELIAGYEQLFATQVAGPTRIIEADMLPGVHRSRYALALCALALLVGLQIRALWTGRTSARRR